MRSERKKKSPTKTFPSQNAEHIRLRAAAAAAAADNNVNVCHKCKLHSLANVRIVPNAKQQHQHQQPQQQSKVCGRTRCDFDFGFSYFRLLIFDVWKIHRITITIIIVNATNSTEIYAKHKHTLANTTQRISPFVPFDACMHFRFHFIAFFPRSSLHFTLLSFCMFSIQFFFILVFLSPLTMRLLASTAEYAHSRESTPSSNIATKNHSSTLAHTCVKWISHQTQQYRIVRSVLSNMSWCVWNIQMWIKLECINTHLSSEQWAHHHFPIHLGYWASHLR